jgi:hypothetical protein
MCQDRVRNSTEHNTEKSRFPRRGPNPGPTEYEAGIVPISPRCWVPRTGKASESVNVRMGMAPNSYEK